MTIKFSEWLQSDGWHHHVLRTSTFSTLGTSPFLSVKWEPEMCPQLNHDILATGPDLLRWLFSLKITLLGEGKKKKKNKIHWESLVIEIFGWVTPCHSFIWSWLNSKHMRGSWKMAEKPLELCKESTNYWWRHLCCLILRWIPTVIELNYWMCHKKHVLP